MRQPHHDADEDRPPRRTPARGGGPGTYRPKAAAQDDSIWVRNGHWRARPRVQVQGPWYGEPAREEPTPTLPPPPANSAWSHYVQPDPAPDKGARRPSLDEAPTLEAKPRRVARVTGPERTGKKPPGPDPEILAVLSDRRFASPRREEPAAERVVPIQRARTRRETRFTELPEWFVTPGWTRLTTGDVAVASEYYEQLVRSGPQHAEGWLGTGAVALMTGKLGEAAAKLSKARDLDPTFPIGRLVREVCPAAPEKWYDLVGQLVTLRRRSAYQCADILLLECLQSREATEGLRQRCLRVRVRIEKALEDRASRDRVRREAWGPFAQTSLRVAMLQSAALVAIILVIFAIGTLLRGRPQPVRPATTAGAVAETAETTIPPPPPPVPPPAQSAASASSWNAAAQSSGDVTAAAATIASTPPEIPPATPPTTDAFLSLADDHGNGHVILVNGQPVGSTPMLLTVPGDHSYVITVVGGERLGDWKQRVKPTVGEQRRVIATLPAATK